MIKEITEFPVIPITEKTFERQGWEKHIDLDGETNLEYYYYMLPLPKDNPDENAPVFISSTNDEWEDFIDEYQDCFAEKCSELANDLFGEFLIDKEEA